MLLRLVPTAPLPTILFTLAFPALPPSLPLPAAWEAHLQLLADARLAAPPSLYALDKAIGCTTLLDTVTFDLTTLTVSCIFIDGTREEWPLTNRCIALLARVVHDVDRSAVEAERAQQPPPPPPPPAPPPKTPKPKKRRSFLGVLLASLGPTPAAAPPPPPPPAEPAEEPEEEEPLECHGLPPARFLRRRARSTLIDAFRRFVAPELAARAPHYALWAARSAARCAADAIARLLDDHDDSASTSTDGSSVHTPRDGHEVPRPTVLAPHEYDAYMALRDVHRTQHAVVRRLVAHAAEQAQAREAEAAVLEVRSRRRAWSNGARGGLGFGMPVRRSPLGRAWTAEVVRRCETVCEEEEGEDVGKVGKEEGGDVVEEVHEDDEDDEYGDREVEEDELDDEDDDDDEQQEDDDEEEDDDDDDDEFALDPARATRLLALPRPKSPLGDDDPAAWPRIVPPHAI